MNSSDIKRRAIELSEKTNSETISPSEVGGIMYDTVSYMEDVQRNGGSLGIRKTYTSVSAMNADVNPVDSEGNPLKKGMIVNIYNPDNAADPDNNKVYAYNAPGWVLTSKLDAGYATKAETDAKFSELESGFNIIDKTDSKNGYINYNTGAFLPDDTDMQRYADYYDIPEFSLVKVHVGLSISEVSACVAIFNRDTYLKEYSIKGNSNSLDYVFMCPKGGNKMVISHNSKGKNYVLVNSFNNFSATGLLIKKLLRLPYTFSNTLSDVVSELIAFSSLKKRRNKNSSQEGYIRASDGKFIAGELRTCEEYNVSEGELVSIYIEKSLASAAATVSFFKDTIYLGQEFSFVGNAGSQTAELVVPNGSNKMFVSFQAGYSMYVLFSEIYNPIDLRGKILENSIIPTLSFGINRLIVTESNLVRYKYALKELYIDLSSSKVESDDGKYYLCRYRSTDSEQIAVGTKVSGSIKLLANYIASPGTAKQGDVVVLKEWESSGVKGYAVVDFDYLKGENIRPDTWAELDKPCFDLSQNNYIGDYIKSIDAEDYPLKELRYDGGLTTILHSLCAIGGSLASGEHEYKVDSQLKYIDLYDYSWVQRIAKICGNKAVNLSKGGTTTKSWLEGEFYQKVAEEAFKCIAYIIMLGNNDTNADYPLGDISDVHVGDEGSNGNTFYGYYSKIIARIKEVQPRAYIFPMTIQRGWGNDDTMQKYNKAIRDIAELYDNTFLIDYYKYGVSWNTSEEFWKNNSRGGHLVASGYQYMAYELCTYIDWIIKNNPVPFKDAAFVGTDYKYE